MTFGGLDVLLKLVRALVFLFDIITFPIYKLLQQPWKERTKQNHGKVSKLNGFIKIMFIIYFHRISLTMSNPIQFLQVVNTVNNSETIAFLRQNGDSGMFNEIIVRNGVDTMTKAFNYAVQKYGEKECLGTRQILGKIVVIKDLKVYKLNFRLQIIRLKYTSFICTTFYQVKKTKCRKMERFLQNWLWASTNG